MPKKKVLILIGDVGGGHKSPALALKKIFERSYTEEFEVKILDFFTEVPIAPYGTSETTTTLAYKNDFAKAVHNGLFRFFSTKIGDLLFRKFTRWRLLDDSIKLIKRESPDILITNHPVVTIVSEALKAHLDGFFSVTQVTDLGTVFRGWADHEADLIICPTSEATQELVKYGVDQSKIEYPMFAINPDMQEFRPKKEVLEEINLDPSKKTILISGGGIAITKMQSGIAKLTEVDDYQLVVLAGKSEKVKRTLEKKFGAKENVRIFGFINNIQDYLNAADLVVAKPGTSSVIESEVFDKKTVFTRKAAMQEDGNVDYLLSNPKFKYFDGDWNNLTSVVEQLMDADIVDDRKDKRLGLDGAEMSVNVIVEKYHDYLQLKH